MPDVTERHLLILRKLPRAPRKATVRELCDYLDDNGVHASVRIVQRDLQKLSIRYSLVEIPGSGRGNAGSGWAYTQNAKTVIQALDPSSALALVMAEQYLEGMIPASLFHNLQPWVAEARKVLDSYNGKGFRYWPDKQVVLPRGQQLLPAKVKKEVLLIIQQALLENRQINAVYNGKARHIHPLGLVHCESVTYLACLFDGYDDMRLTSVHRFSKAEILPDAVSEPKNFNLKQWVTQELRWSDETGKILKLKLKFTAGAGNHLEETPLAENQKIKRIDDETIELTAEVLDTQKLYWWLLAFGDLVEVQSPKKMREWFKETAGRINSVYNKT